MARSQDLSPALPGRWHRQALAKVVPSSAERDEINRLRAELKCVEQERDMLKKVVPSTCLLAQALPTASVMSRYQFIEQIAATKPVQVLRRVLQVSAAGY